MSLLNLAENSKKRAEFSKVNQSINHASSSKIMAGPLGFEPRVFGFHPRLGVSGGRRLNPYWATGPNLQGN